MGIEFMSGPVENHTAGDFVLPSSFDTKLHAAQWTLEGPEVEKAKARQFLVGSKGLTADGWQVYKDDGKLVKRPTSKGVYVLMFRSRDVQDAVNAIYGNISKERMMQEKRGETTGGVPIVDKGMLREDEVLRATGERLADPEAVVFNVIPTVNGPVSTPEILVHST